MGWEGDGEGSGGGGWLAGEYRRERFGWGGTEVEEGVYGYVQSGGYDTNMEQGKSGSAIGSRGRGLSVGRGGMECGLSETGACICLGYLVVSSSSLSKLQWICRC